MLPVPDRAPSPYVNPWAMPNGDGVVRWIRERGKCRSQAVTGLQIRGEDFAALLSAVPPGSHEPAVAVGGEELLPLPVAP